MRVGRKLVTLCFCLTVSVGLAEAQVNDQNKTEEKSVAIARGVAAVPQGSADDRYRIGYQDTLDIQVFKHPELNKRVSVDVNGTITLFRLDAPVVAVCKTESELAKDIEKAYEKDYLRNPEVSVSAVEQKSQSLAVIGAIEKPGNYYVSRRIHLLELLAFAGGPKTGEAGTRLIVLRAGSSSNCRDDSVKGEDKINLISLKVSDVQTGKEVLWMQPGDVVSILPADVVYMYGNVVKQGAVKIKEPLTLTQAIAMADGLKGSTAKEHVRVLREKSGSPDRDELVYDLSQIEKGKAKDPLLEPNDIVAISEDKTKSILNSVARSLTGGLPSLFYRIP